MCCPGLVTASRWLIGGGGGSRHCAGAVDLRGRVLEDGVVKEKVLRAKDQGVSLMIVPKKNLDELQEVEWEKKEDEHYVTESVRGATAFVDLLVLAVQGKFQHVGGPDSSQC